MSHSSPWDVTIGDHTSRYTNSKETVAALRAYFVGRDASYAEHLSTVDLVSAVQSHGNWSVEVDGATVTATPVE